MGPDSTPAEILAGTCTIAMIGASPDPEVVRQRIVARGAGKDALVVVPAAGLTHAASGIAEAFLRHEDDRREVRREGPEVGHRAGGTRVRVRDGGAGRAVRRREGPYPQHVGVAASRVAVERGDPHVLHAGSDRLLGVRCAGGRRGPDEHRTSGAGRSDRPGNPILYRTTVRFDRVFGTTKTSQNRMPVTPFGFQNEQRNYWEAPQIYNTMAPFMHADKMKTPLLLVHGEADNNPGTFTLQTERYFQALKGLGAPVRMVILPKESHGYAAKENILHLLWEQDQFLEGCLKKK